MEHFITISRDHRWIKDDDDDDDDYDDDDDDDDTHDRKCDEMYIHCSKELKGSPFLLTKIAHKVIITLFVNIHWCSIHLSSLRQKRKLSEYA